MCKINRRLTGNILGYIALAGRYVLVSDKEFISAKHVCALIEY